MDWLERKTAQTIAKLRQLADELESGESAIHGASEDAKPWQPAFKSRVEIIATKPGEAAVLEWESREMSDEVAG